MSEQAPKQGFAHHAELERGHHEARIEEQRLFDESYSDGSAIQAEAHAINDAYDNAKEAHAKNEGTFAVQTDQLNEEARLAIYGTEGRTEGYLDPKTGEPLRKPIKGIIEEMRSDPRYGKTPAEREQKAKEAADKYAADVETLLDSGLELAQAKVVMDLRAQRAESLEKQRRQHNHAENIKLEKWQTENDAKVSEYNRNLAKLTNQYILNGESEETAKNMAMARLTPPELTPKPEKAPFQAATAKQLEAADKRMVEKVKHEGIYTLDQTRAYVLAVRSTSLSPCISHSFISPLSSTVFT